MAGAFPSVYPEAATRRYREFWSGTTVDTKDPSSNSIAAADAERARGQGMALTPGSIAAEDALRLSLPYQQGEARGAAQAQLDAIDRDSRSR